MKLKSIIYLLFFCSPMMVMAQMVRFKQTMAPSIAKPGEIVIKGKIGGLNPPRQLWIYIGAEEWDTIAVKNGRFEYRKKTMLPAAGAILVKYTPLRVTQTLFRDFDLKTTYFDAGEMFINSSSDSIKNAVFSGTAATFHNQYYEYVEKQAEISHKQGRLAAELVTTTPENLQSADYMDEYERKMEQVYIEMDSLIESHIRKYPDSWTTTKAFGLYYNKRKESNIDTAKVIGYLDLFSKDMQHLGLFNVPNSGFRLLIEQHIRKSEQTEAKEIRPLLESGDMAPAFTQASLNGSPISLDDFKGRYVLLDFWASWCVPCRKVNPELVELYKKYKGPRFEILGISLDKDHEKWKRAIEEDGLNWKHVSDLKYWDNEVAVKYGVSSIPRSFLLDPEGKIIAVNLKVDDLDAKLGTLLK